MKSLIKQIEFVDKKFVILFGIFSALLYKGCLMESISLFCK